VLQVPLISLHGGRSELSNVSADLEEDGVMELGGSVDQLFQLLFLGEPFCISSVGCQIHGQSHQLLPNHRLWTVDNQLVHQRDAFGVSEGGFGLVFQGQVVQDLQDQGSEPWCLQNLH